MLHRNAPLSHEQLSRIDESDYTGLLTVLGHEQRDYRPPRRNRRASSAIPGHAHRNALSPAMRQACDTVLAETEIIISELLTMNLMHCPRPPP